MVNESSEYTRRKNVLTEADIQVISEIVRSIVNSDHNCRFVGITQEELKEIIESHKKFNAIMDDSKATVRKAVLSILVVAISGMLIEGFWSKALLKIKSMLP